MTTPRLYYLLLHLPNKIKLPLYARGKGRRKQICEMVLKSLESGEAKLLTSGFEKPNPLITKSDGKGFFTSVILKYHTIGKIDLRLGEQALIKIFADRFRSSEEVMLRGDNTRLQLDIDKYRLVTLEARKKWFLPGID
ncbi:MAG: hypothetical protein DI539_05105 [Flavobacterium psychrophilum]|nr:MAG: hypothetical protein DI539_05105 [Flavobacterium psychrophilum]